MTFTQGKNMAFLPKGYQAPGASGHYMKFQQGDNKFRILSAPLLGWEDWLEQKPMRYAYDKKPATSFDPEKPMRHFWAMIVFNYAEETIQILHLTQRSIQKEIEAYVNNSDWGAPYFYDFTVKKEGDKLTTKYFVQPSPHKPVHDYVKQCFDETPIRLEALISGDDPFAKGYSSYTPGIFDASEPVQDNGDELEKVMAQLDPDYVEKVMTWIEKTYNTRNVRTMPAAQYLNVLEAAQKKLAATQETVPF